MSSSWEGLFCALWTPTDANGRLLESALRDNLAFLKERGLQGLLALGSTGEFLHLDLPLRKTLMFQVAEQARPLRLMLNISDVRPGVVAELGRLAHELGADAVSLLPPYFYPVAQEDMLEFFLRAAEAARLPLFLYNFPERTGNRIALETIAAVAERVPLAGVKQSGGEFSYHADLVGLGREKGFVVLTGADTHLLEAVRLGVSGCVSGLSNAVPELVLDALAAARRAPLPAPRPSLERMSELGRRIQAVNFPLHVAAVMEARGLPAGIPKSLVSPTTRARYQQLVRDLQRLLAEWRLV